MISDLEDVIEELSLAGEGTYKNHFYVINIANSDDYAKMYTHLSKVAINTEYPAFDDTPNKATDSLVSYFEYYKDDDTYLLFLMADFANDTYKLKIGRKA